MYREIGAENQGAIDEEIEMKQDDGVYKPVLGLIICLNLKGKMFIDDPSTSSGL